MCCIVCYVGLGCGVFYCGGGVGGVLCCWYFVLGLGVVGVVGGVCFVCVWFVVEWCVVVLLLVGLEWLGVWYG